MSNAFPSMISNEPPPLEQSDDDEDSEGLQDLGHGLNLDLDPSPMATPIKIPKTVSDGNTILGTTESQIPKVSPGNHSSAPTSDESSGSTLTNLPTAASDAESLSKLQSSPSITAETVSTVLEDNREKESLETDQYTEVKEIKANAAVAPQRTEVCDSSKENVRQEVVTNVNFDSCDEDDSCDEFVSYAESKPSTKEEEVVAYISEEVEEERIIPEEVTETDTTSEEKKIVSSLDAAENVEEYFQSDSPRIAEGEVTRSGPAEGVPCGVVEADVDVITKDPHLSEQADDPGAVEDDEEFGEFADFADFNSAPAPKSEEAPEASSVSKILTATGAPIEAAAIIVDDDDDFDEFDDFQAADVTQMPTAPVEQVAEPQMSTMSLPQLTGSRADALVQGLFATDFSLTDIEEEKVDPIDTEIKQDGNESRWKKVEDFEGSQGLMFKWPNSTAYQNLLRSLKIDNSTVMYKGKWGIIEVPRFAASLVDSPLLPESGCKGVEAVQTQFDDYNGGKLDTRTSGEIISGDVPSPNEDERHQEIVSKMESASRNGLSAEAGRILSQLPDLSYMRAKTLVFPTDLPT